MGKLNLAIVIPAFNEGKTIGKIVKLANKYGTTIVINDGSNDSTNQIATISGATVVNHKFNLGYDKALLSGFNFVYKSNFDFMITIDADGQHKPSDIENYLIELREGKDCVVGIRDKPQRISEYLFSFYTKIFWKINDPLCGMKGYNLVKFQNFKNHKIDDLIGTQFLMFALRKNFNVSQIKINQKDRKDIPRLGSSFSSNILILDALIKVICGDIFYFLKSLKKK